MPPSVLIGRQWLVINELALNAPSLWVIVAPEEEEEKKIH